VCEVKNNWIVWICFKASTDVSLKKTVWKHAIGWFYFSLSFFFSVGVKSHFLVCTCIELTGNETVREGNVSRNVVLACSLISVVFQPACTFFFSFEQSVEKRCRCFLCVYFNGAEEVFLSCLSQDESRMKATVMEVQPVDHRDYSRRLIHNIRNMAAWVPDTARRTLFHPGNKKNSLIKDCTHYRESQKKRIKIIIIHVFYCDWGGPSLQGTAVLWKLLFLFNLFF